jgi:hypothetical protein
VSARVVLAALGIAAVAVLAIGRVAPVPSGPPPAGPRAAAAPAASAAPALRPVDPEGIRDVFHFAEDPARAEPSEPGPPGVETVRDSPPAPTGPPPGPRLVGLVRRAGRLAAALAADGEVVLAVPGESAAGVTVLTVGEEGVLVRHPDGREQLLSLP